MYSLMDDMPSHAGFPHSDTSGSQPTYGYPKTFVVRHVLHRLPVPRHSPCALLHLTFLRVLNSSLFENYSFFSFGFSTSATCSFLPKFLCSKNFTLLCFTSSIASYSVFKVLQGLITSSVMWWAQMGSNHRPRAYQARALAY